MKTSLVLFLAAVLTSQAELIHFELSPPGTDAAVGLSPSNQVPAVTNSTGSGNTVSGGIVFNTDSNTLQLAVGYGSAAGFRDLSGPPTGLHIHSPAPPGQNADILIDLGPFDFSANDPAKGGAIIGNLVIPPGTVSNLLAGLDYINIHTALNPNGEIRGQLIPVVASNSPPTVGCPANATVECGSPSQVSVVLSDPEGDALTVVWTVNGMVVQTNTVPASSPPAMGNVSLMASLALGTNVVVVTATDTATNTASCSTTITVVDTTPPLIEAVKAEPNVLWPPNHKMVEVRVQARVTDTCSATTWKIIKVTSNEPVNGLGDGDTAPDWRITGDHKVQLRAERSGKGKGRVYTITVQATDASGNLSLPQTVTVTVPHDHGKGR